MSAAAVQGESKEKKSSAMVLQKYERNMSWCIGVVCRKFVRINSLLIMLQEYAA
jgi:hypothetical protein